MSAEEPKKYIVGPQGGLKISPEWRRWRDANKEEVKRDLARTMSDGFQKHNTSKQNHKTQPKPKLTLEDHKPVWKEIAYTAGSERRIYFCTCGASTGDRFNGCGAVAIRTRRDSPLEIVVQPRFQ